jgi:hypothetical protein
MRERDVRYWPKADMPFCSAHFCFCTALDHLEIGGNSGLHFRHILKCYMEYWAIHMRQAHSSSENGRKAGFSVIILEGFPVGISHFNDDGHNHSAQTVPFLRYPSQCLSYRVDLIVVTAVRKREQFGDEIIGPGCCLWEVHRAAFEMRLV